MIARRLPILVAAAVIIGLAWGGWRLAGQRVNVVIVNASGQPIEFSWQPALFVPLETVTIGGCESKSADLLAGEGWRLMRDGDLVAHASVVSVPPLARRVAVEIRLEPDDSVLIGPTSEVERPIDAPYPPCSNPP